MSGNGWRARAVKATDLKGDALRFPSIRKAVEAGFDETSIKRCLAGKAKHHAGLVWSDDEASDYRAAYREAIQACHAGSSNAEIARITGFSHTTVLKYKRLIGDED